MYLDWLNPISIGIFWIQPIDGKLEWKVWDGNIPTTISLTTERMTPTRSGNQAAVYKPVLLAWCIGKSTAEKTPQGLVDGVGLAIAADMM